MKQKILKFITTITLIMTLTMANFIAICAEAVSYAADSVNVNKVTNNKNVEFEAYFKDKEGNKVENLDAYINSDDLKLFFQLAVKKEGYFNGMIQLNESNFKFKTDILSEIVNKIEENTIYLNQIKAGDSVEVEVGIELLKDNQFDFRNLDKESVVSIQGSYRDSSQKDISINSKRTIKLIISNPYTSSEDILLSQEVITNKILNYNGEDKRVVQIQMKVGVRDNMFPIKKYSIDVVAPKINNLLPEIVLVNSNDVLSTNGKFISQNDWKYNEKIGIININVENEVKDNNIIWNKIGEDKYVITYIFDKKINVDNANIKANLQMEFYNLNNNVLNKDNTILLDNVEKDSIVTTAIVPSETSIYKGKLEAGIERDIVYKNNIDINLTNVANEISVDEDDKIQGDIELLSVLNYKTSKISKSNLESVLGKQGKLYISDKVTGNQICIIDGYTDTDDDGNIIITYPEKIKSINIKVENAEKIGKLEIENTKTIIDIDKNVVGRLNNIDLISTISYESNNKDNKLETVDSIVELKNSETDINLQINRSEISAMTKNNNVEFRITLNSNNEKNELFNNPVISLQLPEKIQDIEVNSINLIYEDELKIKYAHLNNNTIEIALDGQQTKYKDEAIDGAVIIVNANLTTRKKLTNSSEKINVSYINNTVQGRDEGNISNDIGIVSYVGLVTTNQIADYGVEIINNQGEKEGKLELSSDSKQFDVKKQIINNKENKITDIRILGCYPTKNAIEGNNIDSEVGNIEINGVESNKVKIYYTDNKNATEDISNKENKWTDNIDNVQNVKKYLVVINELDILEEIGLSYIVNIPAGLEYNQNMQEGYTVFYKNMTTEEKVENENIKLCTPKGTVVDTELKSLVSGEESDEIKENEILRYAVVVANTGSENVSNVKVVSEVPEGTTYINSDKINNQVDLDDVKIEDETKKQVEFTIDNISEGEEVTKYYEVKVNKGMANKQIENSVTTLYGDVSKQSNRLKTNVSNGDLEMKLVSVDAEDGIVESGCSYRFVLYITNKTNKEMKNVKATVKNDDALNISEMYYIDNQDNATLVEKDNKINISKIEAGETVEVAIYTTVPVFINTTSKKVSLSATSEVDNVEYKSNEINVTATSNLLLNMDVTSENSGKYVKSGNTIRYNVILKNNGEKDTVATLKNWISNDVSLTKIIKNSNEISKDEYSLKIDSLKNKKILKIENIEIGAGETIEFQIDTVVNFSYGNTKAVEIVSEFALEVDSIEVGNAKIEHYLQPDDVPVENNDNTGVNSNNENNVEANNENGESKLISGVVWIDENEDGQRQADEKTLEGIVAKLLDTTTNKFVTDSDGNEITATTGSTGFYSFSKVISKGEYLVIFEYDDTQFGLTTFKEENVSEELNSNVITKDIEINGEAKKVAATEIIKIDDTNISNINMGLIIAKKYDLKLEKFINKVTVQNGKTETNSYENQTLAKQEIDAKQLNGSTVIVEYTIKVINDGEVGAYVRKITDYLSSDYKFNSELNKDWYQSGNDVYCTTLANEEINPGESKELKLIVIKEMTENNTGLINNTAEIVSSYNEYGLTDVNSTEGNNAKGENDMGAADLIISIKTGQVVTTVILSIISIVALGLTAIVIKKFIHKRLL